VLYALDGIMIDRPERAASVRSPCVIAKIKVVIPRELMDKLLEDGKSPVARIEYAYWSFHISS
jgi:hypothetical protein